MSKHHLKGFLTFLLFLFFSSCKTTKNIYFAYKVDTYAINSLKRFVTSSRVISFGDYLFEFRIRTNFRDTLHGETGTISTFVYFDTIGVYLLSSNEKVFYEFDTFAPKNSIIKTGIRSKKEFGHHFSDSDSIYTDQDSIEPFIIIDTLINNIQCSYTKLIPTKKNNDSVEIRLTLVKNKNFNSLYRIGGFKFPDKEYCIVGYSAYSLKKNEGFVQELNALRPLTELEKDICENMVVKSKACIVDTIKEYTTKDKLH